MIALRFEVSEDVASRFAPELFATLADGHPIDESMTKARKSLFAEGHDVEWGMAALYTRVPDGRVFALRMVLRSSRCAATSPRRGRGSRRLS